MMDRAQIERIINALPWPEGKKPSFSFFGTAQEGYVVNLHEPVYRGWTDVAKISGPTPERCLAFAIEKWCHVKGINNDPRFFDAIRRLTN